MSVAHTELNGSGTVQVAPTGMRGQRLFHVLDYADAVPLCEELLGVSRFAGGILLRTPPARYSSELALYCTSTRFEGLGKPTQDASGAASYASGARVVAGYEALPYDPEPDDAGPLGPFVTESLALSGRQVTLPRAAFQWASDAVVLDEHDPAPGRLSPQAEYRLTRHQVPELPKDVLFALLGKVNQEAFAGAGPETLLFLGAEARREVTGAGARAWRLELLFNYDPQGHNRLFRTSTGEFDEIVTKEGSHPLHDPADFLVLLPEAGSPAP